MSSGKPQVFLWLLFVTFFSELGPKGLLSPVSLELKVGGEGNWRQDKNDDEFNDAGENANPAAAAAAASFMKWG